MSCCRIERFVVFLRQIFNLRSLPVDDLALALGDELFAHAAASEADLAVSYQLANVLRSWREMQPEWRLPELAAELANVATGRRKLPMSPPERLRIRTQPRPYYPVHAAQRQGSRVGCCFSSGH